VLRSLYKSLKNKFVFLTSISDLSFAITEDYFQVVQKLRRYCVTSEIGTILFNNFAITKIYFKNFVNVSGTS